MVHDRRTVVAAIATLAMALAGCGGEAGTEDGDADGAKLGAFGVLEFELTSSRAIVEGENGFQVSLRDATNRQPFVAESFSVTPLMGSMGHPSPTEPRVTEHGAGVYDLEHVVFSMPGVWELRLRARNGDVYDDVAFAFDVP